MINCLILIVRRAVINISPSAAMIHTRILQHDRQAQQAGSRTSVVCSENDTPRSKALILK